jgi:hypothetical protein
MGGEEKRMRKMGREQRGRDPRQGEVTVVEETNEEEEGRRREIGGGGDKKTGAELIIGIHNYAVVSSVGANS